MASACVLPDAQSRAHYDAERQETGLQKAERIVKEEIERLARDENQLQARRKGCRAKVMLARRLRQETSIELEMDCETAAHGQLDLRFQPAE